MQKTDPAVPSLAIVLAVLNEAETLAARLDALAALRERGARVIVVDGGSGDDSLAIAREHVETTLSAPRGRASQMNAGAAACNADLLLFLHADTVLPPNADTLIRTALATDRPWGRFDVRIDSPRRLLATVAGAMNLRSRLTGIATGDQAMFMRRSAFESVGGFPPIALMEDIAMSRHLKKLSRPACLTETVLTSARRWEKHGAWRTIWLMWRLRAAFFFGADPTRLAWRYGYAPPEPSACADPNRETP